MIAYLSWLDHDPSERERTNRILALFNEKEARDELGIGSLRDGLAELLFPGTSTIQTRIRYFLFVPWIYRTLEREGVRGPEIARRLRAEETNLVEHLLHQGESQGVFGRVARGRLKRLPSSIYWAGLESWGIRRVYTSQEELHRSFDKVSRAKSRLHRRREEEDALDEAPFEVWDPELPPAPDGFPENASFAMSSVEASYLSDRITQSHPDSLLAWLLAEPFTRVDAPWMHPSLGAFRPEHRDQVHHGRLLAEAMQGAALLYNLLLSEKKGATDLHQGYLAQYRDWMASLDRRGFSEWDLNRFLALLAQNGATVSPPTRNFVEGWLELVRVGTESVLEGNQARALIAEREKRLKGSRSRFTNATALAQWSGGSGLGRMTYRWSTAQRFVEEIHIALGRKEPG